MCILKLQADYPSDRTPLTLKFSKFSMGFNEFERYLDLYTYAEESDSRLWVEGNRIDRVLGPGTFLSETPTNVHYPYETKKQKIGSEHPENECVSCQAHEASQKEGKGASGSLSRSKADHSKRLRTEPTLDPSAARKH